MFRKLIAAIVRDHAVGVKKPELLARLVFGKAFLDEELDNLLRHADTCTSGTQEYGTMIFEWNARFLDGLDEAAKNNSTSPLDVVVEHCIRISVPLKRGERVLKIFVLNHNSDAVSATFLVLDARAVRTRAIFPSEQP